MRRGNSFWADVGALAERPPMTVFDVGANIGKMTAAFHNTWAQATVYAFEPVASTFELLAANTAALPRVRRLPHGLSDHAHSREIFVQPDSGWNSIPKNIDRGAGSTTIDLRTIDAFCAADNVSRIDFLKTDTEGHDLAVLRGGEGMLAQGMIDFIYAEVGFYQADLGHTYFCPLLEYLQRFDYQFLGLYDQDSIWFVAHPSEPCFPWTNALFASHRLVQRRYGTEYCEWLASVGLGQ